MSEEILPAGEPDPILVEKPLTPILEMAMTPLINHLTVINQIYYHREGRNPTDTDSRFQRELVTKAQPYDRERVIGENWELLADKYCWLEECSMLSVLNDEGKFNVVNPTNEQKEAVKEKILEIGVLVLDATVKAFVEIRPQESPCFSPIGFKRYYIRSRKGEINCTVTLYPG